MFSFIFFLLAHIVSFHMNQNFECHNKNMIFAFFIKRSDCHSAAVTLSERIFFTNSYNAKFRFWLCLLFPESFLYSILQLVRIHHICQNFHSHHNKIHKLPYRISLEMALALISMYLHTYYQ